MTDVIHGILQPGPRHIHTKPDMPITSSDAQRRSPYMRALSPQTQDCARGGGDGHGIRRWLLIAYERLMRGIEWVNWTNKGLSAHEIEARPTAPV
jgi:hypothetical protein